MKQPLKQLLSIIGIALSTALCLIVMTAQAVPPTPELLAAQVEGKVAQPYFLGNLKAMHEKGICSGEHLFTGDHRSNVSAKVGRSGMVTAGAFKVLALLVRFSDHPSSVNATYFDSLLFSTNGSTVHNFYDEISYSQIDLVTVDLPSGVGWTSMDSTYAFYVNGQNGTGSYPHNTQKLVEDLVDKVDGAVDFSEYDNDNNGYVDCLLVIHTGTGAELSGSNNDIWSHKWGISPRLKDGVLISSFTVQPEFWHNPGDMTIGVYSHELGHGFGLPDLYDTDYTSNGTGKWDLMSYGTWNGSLGNSPAHPSAWCKKEMGLLTPINVTTNLLAESIATSTQNPTAYRLWNAGGVSNEYFLVENRQKVGYDAALPGSGLLIWHVDESKGNNTKEWWPTQPGGVATQHYLVALEQADGLYHLEQKSNQGDAADPFPGSTNNTDFDALSSPSSDSYTLGGSFVAVQNISASASIMTADLIVGLSAGTGDDDEEPLLPAHISLAQNYPNPFNPSTTIAFEVSQVATAKVEVYNLLGEKVKTLFDGVAAPGETEVTWDGTNDLNGGVASGLYFYKLVVNSEQSTKKMLLVR